jgi:hypothetical protein
MKRRRLYDRRVPVEISDQFFRLAFGTWLLRTPAYGGADHAYLTECGPLACDEIPTCRRKNADDKHRR